MIINGLGYYVWKVWTIEEGDPARIAKLARDAKLTHVLIKIANGVCGYNIAPRDWAKPLVDELHKYNILALGWGYLYACNPVVEAQVAIKRVKETGVDAYVVDAEGECKNKKDAVSAFMAKLRLELPEFPIGLSSYRYPRVHPELPWKEFLSKVDFNMPQVYWEQAHNSAFQLQECVRQFEDLYKSLKLNPIPIIPTGSTYHVNGWEPTDNDVYQFLKAAQELKLSAANFWEVWCCRARVPKLWDVVSNYQWSDVTPTPIPSIEERLAKLEAQAKLHNWNI